MQFTDLVFQIVDAFKQVDNDACAQKRQFEVALDAVELAQLVEILGPEEIAVAVVCSGVIQPSSISSPTILGCNPVSSWSWVKLRRSERAGKIGRAHV